MRDGNGAGTEQRVVAGVGDNDGVTTDWGHLAWLVGEKEMRARSKLWAS